MAETMALTPTLEDYLEAIFRLVGKDGDAHVGDIAKAVSVHKSTVSTALKSLAERKLVEYAPYHAATLTARGREVAREIARRHEVLRAFLADVLGISARTADDNACRMEHAVDRAVLDRLAAFVECVHEAERTGNGALECFRKRFGPAGGRAAKAAAGAARQAEEGTTPMSTLVQLKPGQRAKIVRIGSVGALKRRVTDMGVVKGTPVQVVKVAPLGDPIEIKVKGYSLTLRKAEAAEITVEPE